MVPNKTVKPKNIRKPNQTKPPKFVHPEDEAAQKATREKQANAMKPPSNRNTRVTAAHPYLRLPTGIGPDMNTNTANAGFPYEVDVRRARAFGYDTYGNLQGVPGEGQMEGEEQEQEQQPQ